jgi:DNA-binding response OmpR family regulator
MADEPRILIVDDDPDSGELTRRRLGKAGLDAHYHVGPFGSLAEFDRGNYRLVILDVMMPGLSGTNLIQGLWEREEKRRPRIMLYSSLDEGSLRERALEHGADGWLTKSATKTDLVDTVNRLLESPPDAEG